jgi:hypothetical protein
VAVRAANDAFVDFGLQGSRGRSAGDHSADVSEFRSANVIEVKYDNVVFIAVPHTGYWQGARPLFDDFVPYM